MAILQALTTGQLVDRIFVFYRKNFVLFFSIAIVPQAAYMLVTALPLFGITLAKGSLFATAITAIVGFLVYMCAIAVSQGATTLAVSDVYLEKQASAVDSYRRILPMSLRLIGLMIGYFLLVGLGFMLLIVPGVYFLVSYSLALAVMSIEKVSFSEAMSRSKDLVSGNRGRIAIILLLSFVINYAVAFALMLPAEFGVLALAKTMPILSALLGMVVQLLAGAIAAPISLIGFTLAYYDARVKKEAFDLQYMMESETAARATTAGSTI